MKSNIQPSFCIFLHKPAERNDIGDEELNVLDHVLFRFPDDYISNESFFGFINSIISIYTFTSIGFEAGDVNIIGFKDTKVGIRKVEIDNGEYIFFIARIPCTNSDSVVLSVVDKILNIVKFCLGANGIKNTTMLKNYLRKNGNFICNKILKNNPLDLTFSQILSGTWNRSIIITAITELLIVNSNPSIWGIACFVESKLFISHITSELVSYFEFADFNDNNQSTVYLTNLQRDKVCNFPHCESNIPKDQNEDIQCKLLKFDNYEVTFYLLVSPKITTDEINDILKSLQSSFANMTQQYQQYPDDPLPEFSSVYDKELLHLRSNNVKYPSKIANRQIFLHEMLNNDKRINEIILVTNNSQLHVCLRTQTLEFYSSNHFSNDDIFNIALDSTLKLLPDKAYLIEKYL